MLHVVQKLRTACPYLILGIRANASRSEIESAYNSLITLLNDNSLSQSPQAWVQAQQACLAIENAYERVLENDDDGSVCCDSFSNEAIHPRLGQMLVSGGFITLEQLAEALERQDITKDPIGQILIELGAISQEQLDSILLSQHLLTIGPLDAHHLGQRLVALGLITEDMLNIARLEQASGKDIGQLMVDKGWLAQEILDCLTGRLALSM